MKLPVVSVPQPEAALLLLGAQRFAAVTKPINGTGAVYLHAAETVFDEKWIAAQGQERLSMLHHLGISGDGDMPINAILGILELAVTVDVRDAVGRARVFSGCEGLVKPDGADWSRWKHEGRMWALGFGPQVIPLERPWTCQGRRDPWLQEVPSLTIQREVRTPARLFLPYNPELPDRPEAEGPEDKTWL